MIRKQPVPQPEDLYLNFQKHPFVVWTDDGVFIGAFSNLECAARTAVWQKGWGEICTIRHESGKESYTLDACRQIAANAHLEAVRQERERTMKGWGTLRPPE